MTRLWDLVFAARGHIERNGHLRNQEAVLCTERADAIAEALQASLPYMEGKYGSSSTEAQAVREQLQYLRDHIPTPGASIAFG